MLTSNKIIILQLKLVKIIDEGKFSDENSTRWLFFSTNVRILFFVEGGKLEDLKINCRRKDDNRKQTQPICETTLGRQTQVTRVGGQCSY